MLEITIIDCTDEVAMLIINSNKQCACPIYNFCKLEGCVGANYEECDRFKDYDAMISNEILGQP